MTSQPGRQPRPPTPRGYCSIEEAAMLLGVSRRTVERMIARGTLGTYRLAAQPIYRWIKMAHVRRLAEPQPDPLP